ncbi:MAG: DUF5107 domain-containing protein [Parabacteroides sp.]
MKSKLVTCLLLCAAPLCAQQQVQMQSVTEKIPTYKIGAPEVDPIFFTGRVYQGAEGYIYPYPLYDVMTEEQEDKAYNVLRLHNEYVDLSILPEIGGRIFAATDRTNDYHFFYTQTGIKPALIGMLGAWLSGGVEWNIPDHHRASSYMPVNWKMEEYADGSKTIWVGETELRHRLKWSVGITVYPGRSWVESRVKVINPTPMIQSMLYWANVSVHCNEQYQVIFPPDVQAGADHHKIYFTPWPVGPFGSDRTKNADLSWWKNFTDNSRSIFAWGSQMEFLAGYDYGKDAGTVHVANRHVVPGKKFFLWGNNPNGQMWNKILSDNDGHYLELMVGAYSDNQPDYSWINPGEIREFRQIWYPIKGIRGVKNATDEAAVNFEPSDQNGHYRVGYCVTKVQPGARIVVKQGEQTLLDKKADVDPDHYFLEEVQVPAGIAPQELYTALYDAEGKLLVEYRPVKLQEKPLPKVIDGTKPVQEYKTNEELYLAGLRVDQFNNARLQYMDFYEEALRRDSMDARVNIEVGKHYIRQGEWALAEKHLLRAQARLTHDYTRVKDAEALYYLGYLYRMTGRVAQAEEALWAATWTPDYKHPAFYQLAVAAVQAGDYAKALELIEQSLYVGSRDLQALSVKAYVLRRLGCQSEAAATLDYIRSIDPLDYWSEAERSFLQKGDASFLKATRPYRSEGLIAMQELLEVVANYMTLGATDDALALLREAVAVGTPFAEAPLVHYYIAYNLWKQGKLAEAEEAITRAGSLSPLHNYPLRLEELSLFDVLLQVAPEDAKLHYYQGNLLYYLGQKERGLTAWERSVALDPSFSIANRNAGFGEGVKGNLDRAISYYDQAILCNPDDALLLTESDKLYEQANRPFELRLKRLEKRMKTVLKHDDAVMRLLTLYNEVGQYDKAIRILDTRHFHLWEGGGQVHDIYVDSHMLKGLKLLTGKQYAKAVQEFGLAGAYPVNLEVAEPSHGGYTAKWAYLSGLACEGQGKKGEAQSFFEQAAAAEAQGGLSDLGYYKVRALSKLGRTDEAKAELDKLIATRERFQKNLMDSYAKFGDANRNVQQSNMCYFSGLIDLLQDKPAEAKQQFEEALRLYPGHLWAKWMKDYAG